MWFWERLFKPTLSYGLFVYDYGYTFNFVSHVEIFFSYSYSKMQRSILTWYLVNVIFVNVHLTGSNKKENRVLKALNCESGEMHNTTEKLSNLAMTTNLKLLAAMLSTQLVVRQEVLRNMKAHSGTFGQILCLNFSSIIASKNIEVPFEKLKFSFRFSSETSLLFIS